MPRTTQATRQPTAADFHPGDEVRVPFGPQMRPRAVVLGTTVTGRVRVRILFDNFETDEETLSAYLPEELERIGA